MIKKILVSFYTYLFCRPWLLSFNYHRYKLALRSLGVLNSGSPKQTGEIQFLARIRQQLVIKTIIDVGANDGGYAMMLKRFFPDAKIYACEPHPLTYKILAKNNQITSINVALDDQVGQKQLWDFHPQAELKKTQPTSTLASFYPQVITGLYRQKAESYRVKTTTLDQLANRLKLKTIDLLKIDTEGNEFKVLLGAKTLIAGKKIKLIIFEFNEMNVYSRTFFIDYLNYLRNYQLFRLSVSGLIPLNNYRPVTHEIFAFQDIVAVLNGIDIK